jgi:hypothetical protein
MTEKYYVFEFGQLEEYDKAKVKMPFCLNHGKPNKIVMHTGANLDSSLVFEFGIHSKIPLFDQIFNLESYRLVSPRFLEILTTFDDSIQSFNTLSKNENDEHVAKNYSVANFTTRVDCFDWENSLYDDSYKEMGIASRPKKIILIEEKIPKEANIFLLKGMTSEIIIFKEKVKSQIENIGLTGVKLIELSQYSW